MGMPLLTKASAQQLIATIDKNAAVLDLQHLTNTNDVFKVLTERHDNYYVKFHTAKWYKEAEDTYVVVRREQSVFDLLNRKGIPLAYRSWSDCSRSIVDRSVLITSELPGIPLTTALIENPTEQQQILAALARFLKALHAIVFPRAGYIELSGDADIHYPLDPADHPWGDSHPCQKPENLRKFALGTLGSKSTLLPPAIYDDLRRHFENIPDILRADYAFPRFVINNYHPHHIHVQRKQGGWTVTGLYDFEAASSGNPTFDLALNDLQITPILHRLSWRYPFYETYGYWPAIEAYKSILLSYVLLGLGETPGEVVPDPEWLIKHLPHLLRAERIEDLCWYPDGTTKGLDKL